jgi:hypothetical protein
MTSQGTGQKDGARRQLLLRGILPSVVALLVAGHLWLLVQGNGSARSAYDAQRYSDARSGFEGARDFGVLKPWVARFDAGTAAYREGDFRGAAKLFQAALPDAPDEHECDVRIDLALSHEATAAKAAKEESRAAAQIALRDARTALGGGGCSAELEERIEKKIHDLDAEDPSSQPDQDLTEEQKLEELKRRNDEAQRTKDPKVDPQNEPSAQIQW